MFKSSSVTLGVFRITLLRLLLLGLSLLLIQLCQGRLVVPTDMGGQTRVAASWVNRTVSDKSKNTG